MSLLKKIKPKGYSLATLFVSIGGFLNGFDTGSIGAITEMPQFTTTFGELTPFMRGFAVSLLMLTGAMPSFFAGYLSDKYGRLAIAGLGASIFLVGVIMEGAAGTSGVPPLPVFLVGRALAGIGEGFWLGCVTVYVTEIAPSATRGTHISLVQLATALGVCLGYFVCYGSIQLPSSISWRLPFIIQAILSATLAISCAFLPSSPRWLVLHGRRDEALKVVERLGLQREEAEKDILTVTGTDHEQLERGYWSGLKMLWRGEYRKRTSLALIMLGAAQLSGIDGVLYYAPTLFAQAGLTAQTASFLASGVSAILMLAITIPSVLLVDRIPRRLNIISGGVILASSMFLIGTLYASNSVHAGHGIARWVVIVSIFVIALDYCFTWAVVCKLYASEIQPAKTRASANSVAQGMSFFCNWIVAFTTPIFLSASNSGVYFLFGGITLATVAVMAAYMPETKGRPLESIHQAFNEPLPNPIPKFLRQRLRRRVVEPLASRPSSRSDAGGSQSQIPVQSEEQGTPATEAIELRSFSLASASGLRVEVGGGA